MTLVGKRTYAVCITIILMAACQKFLSLQIPNEVWLALFGLAVITLRASVQSPTSDLRPPTSGIALLLLPALLLFCPGCANMTEGKIDSYGKIADSYYNSANVAELWRIENTNAGQVCEFTVRNFTSFSMSTPVPPKNILPREPSFSSGFFDALKTVAPYAFMYGIFTDGGLGNRTTSSISTVNNNAAATP
ncbi:MAG: hypothetical protein WCP22_13920 [Chlamydiota bacterium]